VRRGGAAAATSEPRHTLQLRGVLRDVALLVRAGQGEEPAAGPAVHGLQEPAAAHELAHDGGGGRAEGGYLLLLLLLLL
jgi:hypothetical protein